MNYIINKDLEQQFRDGKIAITGPVSGENRNILRYLKDEKNIVGDLDYYTFRGMFASESSLFNSEPGIDKILPIEAFLVEVPEFKTGDAVQVTDDDPADENADWFDAVFIGINPLPDCVYNYAVALSDSGGIEGYRHCIKAPETISIEEAEKRLGIRIKREG